MFKPYTRSNQGCKLAAPTAKDARSYNKKPPVSLTGGPVAQPMLGEDYHYGYAAIVATKKHSLCSFDEINPDGWMLPGGRWTNNSEVVKRQAMEIDRLIRLCGGLKEKAA